MKFQKPQGVPQKKALFVWDGSGDWFAKADQLIANLRPSLVYAVHAMPHESIYHYGATCPDARFNWLETELREKFRSMASQFKSFRNVKLSLLIGDQVREIAEFANRFKVDTVLVPKFEQSVFSTWIHGDLNQKFRAKVLGNVTILNCETVDGLSGKETDSPDLDASQ